MTIKHIYTQNEGASFSLYLIEKDGKSIIVRKWHFSWGYNFQTKEEADSPEFEIIELGDTGNQPELQSFVQAIFDGTQNSHPLSMTFRIKRDAERECQYKEAEAEQKMRGRY